MHDMSSLGSGNDASSACGPANQPSATQLRLRFHHVCRNMGCANAEDCHLCACLLYRHCPPNKPLKNRYVGRELLLPKCGAALQLVLEAHAEDGTPAALGSTLDTVTHLQVYVVVEAELDKLTQGSTGDPTIDEIFPESSAALQPPVARPSQQGQRQSAEGHRADASAPAERRTILTLCSTPFVGIEERYCQIPLRRTARDAEQTGLEVTLCGGAQGSECQERMLQLCHQVSALRRTNALRLMVVACHQDGQSVAPVPGVQPAFSNVFQIVGAGKREFVLRPTDKMEMIPGIGQLAVRAFKDVSTLLCRALSDCKGRLLPDTAEKKAAALEVEQKAAIIQEKLWALLRRKTNSLESVDDLKAFISVVHTTPELIAADKVCKALHWGRATWNTVAASVLTVADCSHSGSKKLVHTTPGIGGLLGTTLRTVYQPKSGTFSLDQPHCYEVEEDQGCIRLDEWEDVEEWVRRHSGSELDQRGIHMQAALDWTAPRGGGLHTNWQLYGDPAALAAPAPPINGHPLPMPPP